MSDISLNFSLPDYLIMALVAGSPGLVVGAGLGAFAWRRRRILGAVFGAVLGALLCNVAAYWYMVKCC
jgi:hypothetical protein